MKKIAWVLFWMSLTSNLWAMARRPPAEPATASSQLTPAPVELSLDIWDCYQMAMRRSETLAIRKEEIGRTLSSYLESNGEIIGDINYVSTDFWQDPQKAHSDGTSSVGSTLTSSERRERRFELTQPLFQGFKALGALSAAGSLRKQKIGDWERAKQLLFMDTINAFYDYLHAAEDVRIIQGIIDLSQDRIKDLKEWEDIGRSRPSESATARSNLENFNSELAASKGREALAKNLLAFLIGVVVRPHELKEESGIQKPDQKEDIMELARMRPDVQASRYAVTSARGGFIIAQSDLWPKITLDGNLYEHREGFQSGISWDMLVTLNVPLGTGGTTLGKIRDALGAWRESKLAYSLSERTALREIQDAQDNWENRFERYQALEKAVKAAQENFTLQQEDYKRRLVSNLDVLDALRNLFESKRDANEAYFDTKKSYWQLQVAEGKCCEEPVGV